MCPIGICHYENEMSLMLKGDVMRETINGHCCIKYLHQHLEMSLRKLGYCVSGVKVVNSDNVEYK